MFYKAEQHEIKKIHRHKLKILRTFCNLRKGLVSVQSVTYIVCKVCMLAIYCIYNNVFLNFALNNHSEYFFLINMR